MTERDHAASSETSTQTTTDDPFVYDNAAEADSDAGSTVTETVRDQLTSRRSVLGGVAAAGLGAVGLSGGAAGRATVDADPAQAASVQEDETTDVDILNYALTLEHLEYNFYEQGLKEFDDCEIRNAHVVQENLCESQADALPEQLGVIRDHEGTHVDGIGKVLENTGVAAYAGAAPSVNSDAVLKAAVSIHSVEARHAASLNALNGVSPFPDAFDEPKTMEEVKEAASAFIVECE